jgi:serine phosphatase RsbU (regulator of sigma subunit)/PAS domain-containing protein
VEGLRVDRVTVGIALAALLVVTLMAIALDSPGPLLVLLAAGPLIASTRCGVVVTAIVGLLALTLAIALGWAGESEHLTAALAVAGGGAVAVIAAHLRIARGLRPGRRQPTAAPSNGNGGATRAQLEAMLRGVADAVTAQAPDGRLIYANEAAVKTLGFESREALQAAPSADVLGRFDIFDEAGRPFPLGELPGRRALQGEEAPEAIVRFRVRATGEERWAAIKANPIRDGAGQVSMAMNVIEDITAHKRAELSQGFLSRSSHVLSGWLDSKELLRRVARLAIPEMADWCAVDLLKADGRLERVELAHADPDLREQALELSRRYPPTAGTPGGAYEVMHSGEPRLFAEVSDELLRSVTRSQEHYDLLRALGVRSVIVVPMRTRDRTLGALSFATGPSGRRYDEYDVEVAHELARRCATALDNNRLYSERSYIARTLQEGLLPLELAEVPGIEAAVRFRHSGDGGEVGGDFYDLFETGSRGWTVVIGDVCGKGPDAAAVTALARYTLRTAALRHRLPSRSLSILNEALLRQRSDRRFCTVAYAYLEKLDGGARVGFASGGHPLPLVLHSDGTVEAVGTPGTLLGVVPDPDLEDHSLTLSRGDALVLFTDGVIEPRGAGETLDEARLAELVAGCAGRGADAIAAEIEQAAVRSHAGSPRDDIAVLVLRVAP